MLIQILMLLYFFGGDGYHVQLPVYTGQPHGRW